MNSQSAAHEEGDKDEEHHPGIESSEGWAQTFAELISLKGYVILRDHRSGSGISLGSGFASRDGDRRPQSISFSDPRERFLREVSTQNAINSVIDS